MNEYGFSIRLLLWGIIASLLSGCIIIRTDSPELHAAKAAALELCRAEGGQKVYSQVEPGSGLAILQLKAFYQDLGIDRFDHPDLKAMLNPDGVSLKEEALRELASRPQLNLDDSGIHLLNDKIDYYDLHIGPARARRENRSMVSADGPVGMYRFRTASLASPKCDRYKQVIAETSDEEALYPDAKIRAAFAARGQCYYAEHMGTIGDPGYQFPKYLFYTYGVTDTSINVFRSEWLVYNTESKSLVARDLTFGVAGLRPVCGETQEAQYPYKDVFDAAGISDDGSWQ